MKADFSKPFPIESLAAFFEQNIGLKVSPLLFNLGITTEKKLINTSLPYH